MFRKLQFKFMWVSTLVLLMVICIVVGTVYWIVMNAIMSQTGVLMELILDNDGELPERSDFNARQERFLALNTESLYEARFFSVEDMDGVLTLVTRHIMALSEEDALALAETALDLSGDIGKISVAGDRIFHYLKRDEDDNSTMIVVLDATSRYGLIHLIMTYMAALWLSVLLLYIIIMGRFSGRLVRPFIENDEKQKRFITNASHELKTPLAIISANMEMTELMGGKSKWTESSMRQIERLQALIEDLVVLARLDEMKEMDMSDVDLSAIVSETAESFRSVAESAEKHFQAEIAPGLHLRGDGRGLQQVVSILLDNAVKYCHENGTITVRLEIRSHSKGARITVSNTYMADGDVATSRFFERFYRQDKSHNSEKPGFGIGLSMAKEIVERMKGKLKASYSNQTIRFTIEI